MSATLKMEGPNGLVIDWTEEGGFEMNPKNAATDSLKIMLTDDLANASYLAHVHRVHAARRVVEELLPGVKLVSMTGGDKPMEDPKEGVA